MLDWLQFLYGLCTSDVPPANWREITIVANAAIAAAYFWIPAVMAVVFSRWSQELPYPWLWGGFVTFISACGASHVMHAFHALRDATPHTQLELAILILTAVVSLVTAAGFTILLPRILRLTSPTETRQRLETAVDSATKDLRDAFERQRILLLEVHHRVKNNLQVTSSLVNLHLRRSSGEEAGHLKALRDRILAMASVHSQLQSVNAASIDAHSFLESLGRSVSQASGQGEVDVEVDGDNFEVPLDHAVSFALIMHEAITNAVRHGSPSRSAPVLVETAVSSSECVVRVIDPGSGGEEAGPDGIGKTLMSALAVQLQATTSWFSLPDGRMVFKLAFPAAAGNVDRLVAATLERV